MKLTLLVKLAPTPDQHGALLETMERFNEACNDIADIAYHNRTGNKIRLQKIVYYRIRKQYGLSAQMTIRAISKTTEAYKRARAALNWKKGDIINVGVDNGSMIVTKRVD